MNPQQYATYNPQQQQQFYGNRTTSFAQQMGQYATMGKTTNNPMGGMMMNAGTPTPMLHMWVPQSPQEQQYYDHLFMIADVEKRNAIGGRIAVEFFSRSKLDKLQLREIWTIADSQQKSELSHNEFYVAMRLISMAQRGEPISAQRFFELAAMQYPFPVLEGVPPPPVAGPPSGIQQMPTSGIPGRDLGSGGSLTKATYAVNDEEKARYDGIFQQYDSDNDGFLAGPEAVALFQMSGLDRNALRNIWSLADIDQDSKLDRKEFYVAMHLIVCASKRGLPVPTELPAELKDSVFGTTRNSFSLGGATTNTMPSGGIPTMSGPPSRNGSLYDVNASPSPAPETKGDPMDAFAGLSPAKDSPLPSFGSFSGTLPQVNPSAGSSASSDHGSFHQPSPANSSTAKSDHGSFHAPPAPVGTSTVGQDQSSWPSGGTMQQAGSVSRDRTNSASSMSSMSSFSGLSTTPSVSASDSINMIGVPSTTHHHPSPSPGGMMGSYGMPHGIPPMAPTAPVKPFLSDEEERQAVHQLEAHNEVLTQSLSKIETKQNAIETLSEKLRELDQLRHELVTLVMRRDNLKATAAAAATTPSASASSAQAQSKRAVEDSLRDLIANEKQLIQQLQVDITKYEQDLREDSLSSSFDKTMKLTTPPSPAPTHSSASSSFTLMMPLTTAKNTSIASSSSFTSSTEPAEFSSFGDFGRASSTSTQAPAPANFTTDTPTTSSDNFAAFGDFEAAPTTTTSINSNSSSSFDAFSFN